MKRKFYGCVLVLMLVFSAILMIGCLENDDYGEDANHQHTFESSWTFDIENHWHKSTCGHTNEISEKSAHSFTSYVSDNNATYTNDGTKTAKCDVCDATNTIIDEGSMLIYSVINFKTLSVGLNNNIYGKVNNGTSKFSFIDEIEVVGNATFKVYADEDKSIEIEDKIATLQEGNNIFYVLAENLNNGQELYVVNVRVRQRYTVSFDTLGGTNVNEQTVEEDGLATQPKAPTKEGYSFVGWDFDFTTPITENTVITANTWQANEYTISFDSNGGNSISNKQVLYNDEYSFEVPGREGFMFVCWKTQTGDILTDIQGDGLDKWKIAAAITVYAEWKEIKNKITYHNVDGAKNTNVTGYSAEDEKIVLVDAEKIGYEFLGWYDSSLDTANKVTIIDTANEVDIDLYARWSLIQYEIKYELNRGTNNSDNPSHYTIEDEITLKNATRTDYRFTGWYIDEECTIKLEAGTTILKGTYGDITLYAGWKEEYSDFA